MSIFKKIKKFIEKLFTNVFDKFRLHSELAVTITQNLKNVVENPLLRVTLSIIPGNVGKVLLPLLPKAIELTEKIALKVAIANNILSQDITNGDVVSQIVIKLRESYPLIKTKFWQDFGTELIIALADGEISKDEAWSLRELVYQELKVTKFLKQ